MTFDQLSALAILLLFPLLHLGQTIFNAHDFRCQCGLSAHATPFTWHYIPICRYGFLVGLGLEVGYLATTPIFILV